MFQAYQHRDNVGILEDLREFFGCGSLVPKGPKSSVVTYSVHARRDLESVIIPFFERHPLVSKKRLDFLTFAKIVRMMRQKEHLTDAGFRRIVELAFTMNQHGKQRKYRREEILAEPSETVRRAPVVDRVKIQSDPHGDVGRAAEMTAPLSGQPGR